MFGTDGGAAFAKAPGESDIRLRPDRLGKHFEGRLGRFAFDELSERYIERQGLGFMRGVPIPLRDEDVGAFAAGEGLSVLRLGANMAQVMGASPGFAHTGAYVGFLKAHFREKAAAGLVRRAKEDAARGDHDSACIHFRAALCVEPDGLDAMYGYALACRDMYGRGGSSEYVGSFKAESLEYFELTTLAHPRFPAAYYYLGYAYLNLGLYQKAALAWKGYLDCSTHPEDRGEIKGRLRQLAEPIEIERGCNAVLARRWDEGIGALEPYLGSRYGGWWPLYYYLGAAYANTGRSDEAADMFRKALRLNPSHAESMDELAFIYDADGDRELSMKYRRKAELVRRGGHR
ncbi:MAG: tetratricopeptide repeat protein [Clostridiales Family XIII bacterium]|jgi:tetratricopeptide (TPR) repeat protein|nr:tetratricopeptide repeat protein [Clostridiales Family XIII bacterium]